MSLRVNGLRRFGRSLLSFQDSRPTIAVPYVSGRTEATDGLNDDVLTPLSPLAGE